MENTFLLNHAFTYFKKVILTQEQNI